VARLSAASGEIAEALSTTGGATRAQELLRTLLGAQNGDRVAQTLIGEVARTNPLTSTQRAIRDALVHEHPNLNPNVAAEAAIGAREAMGAGGAGGDLILANGLRREVSVHTGELSNLGSHILAEANQVGTREIFMQISREGVTQQQVLSLLQGPNGLRNTVGDAASGLTVRIFGPNGESWWSGVFR
jgi:hypothetical protein